MRVLTVRIAAARQIWQVSQLSPKITLGMSGQSTADGLANTCIPLPVSRAYTAHALWARTTSAPTPTKTGVDSLMQGQQNDRDTTREFALERYKYLLQQIHTVNENVYRFLAIYQTLSTALVSSGLVLFVGYKKWGILTGVAHAGIIAVMWLQTAVAASTSLLILTGLLNWVDYRREECELTDRIVYPGFREPIRSRNFYRWYETHILVFIGISTTLLWILTLTWILPAMPAD
jgi:hypothetical protein